MLLVSSCSIINYMNHINARPYFQFKTLSSLHDWILLMVVRKYVNKMKGLSCLALFHRSSMRCYIQHWPVCLSVCLCDQCSGEVRIAQSLHTKEEEFVVKRREAVFQGLQKLQIHCSQVKHLILNLSIYLAVLS